MDGVAVGPGVVTRGTLRLRVASFGLKSGARVTVSIRPHEIELVLDHQARALARGGENLLRGMVQRVSYLVEGSDVILRVAAPPLLRFQPGEAVSLAVAPAACVPLTEGDT